MASQKISQLTAITTVASGDYFPIVQASGTSNKRVEVGVLDARYTLSASGVAAQSTANTALASGNAALFVADAAGSLANQAMSSGLAGINAAATKLPLTGGTLTGPLTASGFVSASGFVYDNKGDVRNIPSNSQSSMYVLQSSDTGKYVSVASGVVRIPSGVFGAGQVFSIFNNSVGTQTISGSVGTTLRKAGSTDTGQRSLDAYGLSTVLCVGSETFVITGAGLT